MDRNIRKKWNKDNIITDLPNFENTEAEIDIDKSDKQDKLEYSISRWRLKTHKYIHKNTQKLTKINRQCILEQ